MTDPISERPAFPTPPRGLPADLTTWAGDLVRTMTQIAGEANPRLNDTIRKANDVPHVTDFGAKVDGIVDDTIAFQAFLTHLATEGGTGLFFGTVLITSPIEITSNAKPFRLLGVGRAGAKIIVGTDIATPLTFAQCTEVIVEGFSLDCQFSSFTSNANHGIRIDRCDDFLMRDVHVEDYKNTGVIVQASVVNTNFNVILDAISVDGLANANNGMLFVDYNESGMRHCRVVGINGSPGHGLQLKNDCRRCFIENSFADNCLNGMTFAADGSTGPSQCRSSNVFCKGSPSNGAGFSLGKATNNKITGLLIDMESVANAGIDFQDGCVSNDIEATIDNVTNAKGAVRFLSGATDNMVRLTYLDNNNTSGNAVIYASGSLRNTVILERAANLTSSDPYDLVADASTGSTNIFDYKALPLYQKLVIATGVITLAHPNIKSVVVDTQNATTTDDLDTINGGLEGSEITLRQEILTRDVTVKHNTGNILLDGSADLVFTNPADTVRLRFNTRNSAWCEVGRGNNA